MIRKFIKFIFTISIIYFIGGLVITKFFPNEFFTFETYFLYAAIVGGIASVFGLLALALPVISTSDLKSLEIESLRKVADLAEEMQNADKEIKHKSQVINNLSVEKKQLELLVRKASMSLYLQNKYELNEKQLVELFRNNQNIKEQLIALGEEVQNSENQDLLEEIIKIVKEREAKDNLLNESGELLWIKPNIMGIGIDVNMLVKRLFNIIKRT